MRVKVSPDSEGRQFWDNRPSILLPSSEVLLAMDGDDRIIPGENGNNAYGCPPRPEPGLFNFASSTASAISVEAFEAVEEVREQLNRMVGSRSAEEVYAEQMQRLRKELLDLCGLGTKEEVDVLFSASGTDMHRIFSALFLSLSDDPVFALTVDSAETGRGVQQALLGPGLKNYGGDCKHRIEVATLSLRDQSGNPRPSRDIDTEAERYVKSAISNGYRVLIVMVDISKTGLIAPSLSSVLALQRYYPGRVTAIVDACQFRLSAGTLRTYLAQGINIILTGSKFLGGPAFSGAGLLPRSNRASLRTAVPDDELDCVRADFPPDWPGVNRLKEGARFGLLLRWKAALYELRLFYQLSESRLIKTVQTLEKKMEERFLRDPALHPLHLSALERHPFPAGEQWDRYLTIFPFLIMGGSNNHYRPLSRAQIRIVYEMLPQDLTEQPAWAATLGSKAGFRCRVGQPIGCGQRDGVEISALRLTFSARSLVEATQSDSGFLDVYEGAMDCLDKCVLLGLALN